MKVKEVSLFIVLISLALQAYANAGSSDVLIRIGVHKIKFVAASGIVTICSIDVKSCDSSIPYCDSWLTNGEKPLTYISNIKIAVHGKSVPVPMTSFYGLVNARWVGLTHTNNGYRLAIRGGTSVKYIAYIDFTSDGVAWARVGLADHPGVWETSIYSINEQDDDQ